MFSGTARDTRARFDQNSYSHYNFAILAIIDNEDPSDPKQIDLEDFYANANGITIDAARIKVG